MAPATNNVLRGSPPRPLRLLGLALLWGSVLCGGEARVPLAYAGDPVEDARVASAETLLKQVATLRAAQRRPELERALARVPQAHNALKTRAARAKLRAELGQVMGAQELGSTRSIAADVLGQLNDPKGAWKELKPFLPAVKLKAAGPFPLRVIQAVGVLACDASITSLMKLMEKAKDPNVARYAIGALGKYGWSKRRVSVLGDLVDFLRKLRPGGTDLRKSRGGGRAARERYNFLQLSLVAAMNELTGQKLDSADKWLSASKEHKKALTKLFIFER